MSQQSQSGPSAPGGDGVLVRAFLPGLVIGLIAGGFIGVWVGSRSGYSQIKIDPNRPASTAPATRDGVPVTTDETATDATEPVDQGQPAGSPEPEKPKDPPPQNP